MRLLVVLMVSLLAAPLAGCIGPGPVAVTDVFAAWTLPEGSPTPAPVGDCTDLLALLNARALEEAETYLAHSVEGKYHMFPHGPRLMTFATDIVLRTAQDAKGTARSSAAEADVTGTNNQEAGVDEADVLKTDGEWTYVLRGHHLYILHSEQIGEVVTHARIALDNQSHSGVLLLEPRDPDDPADDRLIVVTREWDNRMVRTGTVVLDYGWYGSDQTAHVYVFELADRGSPTLVDEMWIEGDLKAARLIDGFAYIVVHADHRDLPLRTRAHPTEDDLQARGLDWGDYWSLSKDAGRALRETIAKDVRAENRALIANATLADHLSSVARPGPDGEPVVAPVDDDTCARFLAAEGATGRSITTILAMDVEGAAMDHAFTQVVGSSPIVYASDESLVLAAASRDAWWFLDNEDLDEATDLQWFDLAGLDVTHRASGRAAGLVQDSFGIDVHGDELRIATTTGQWNRVWLQNATPMMNHVAVMHADAGQLVPTGIVGGIAPGERLWSARFTDDRAYLVTFEQIDPLWIIDLTDPARPQILGELEIPGVSTYIHPLSDELLLTIGMGPGAGGVGLDWGRLQVNLFDIRDESKPRLADQMDLTPAGGHSWSGALREHKAFTYWDRLGMLAIPVATHRQVEVGPGLFHYDNHVGLRLIKVDTVNQTLTLHGEVDQEHLDQDTTTYYRSTSVERSYFLGHPGTPHVSVYAMSNLGMSAHDLATLARQGHVGFQD